MKLIFTLLFIVATTLHSFGQIEHCAVEPLSQSESEFYAAALAELDNSGNIMNTTDEEYSIPIHLYISKDQNGLFPYSKNQVEIEAIFLSALRYVNESLEPRISFYVSELDVLEVPSNIYTENTVTTVYNYYQQNLPNGVDDNTVNIFLSNTNSATGRFPSGVNIGGGNTSGRWLLHELGHYFGLFHPHHLAHNSNTFRAFLYPNGTPTPSYPIDNQQHIDATQIYCDQQEEASCYGDFIVSTPPDLRDFFSDDLFTGEFTPDQEYSVQFLGDPNVYVYHPDFMNVMSYWNVGSTVLNQDQKDRMYDVLMLPEIGVPPFGGNMTFLIDEDIPIISYQLPNLAMLRQSAEIDLVSFSSESNHSFTPFFQGRIPIKYNGSNNVSPHTRPYIGKGLLKINPFIQFGEPNASIQFDYTELSDGCEDLEIYSRTHLDVGDIMSIQNHIMGVELFDSPYKYIAADVDNSASINVGDMVGVARVILGLDENFIVPDFQFMPRYILSDEFQFANSFMSDPFTAQVNYNGQIYSYSGQDGFQSYLGSSVSVDNNDYIKSLSIPYLLSQSSSQQLETLSQIAIRTGDVDQTEPMQGLCQSSDFDDLFVEDLFLEAGKEYTIRISYGKDSLFLGVDIELEILSSSSQTFRKTNNSPNHGTELKLDYVLSDSVDEFVGLIRSSSKIIRALVIPTDDIINGRSTNSNSTIGGKNNLSYFEFTLSPSKQDVFLSDIVKVKCIRNGNKLNSKSTELPKPFIEVSSDIEMYGEYKEANLKVFPNPVGEVLNIYSSVKGDVIKGSVSILNINGEVIYEVDISLGAEPLSVLLPSISSGSYYVRLVTEEGQVSVNKFVKL
jgi:hypothetical protein